MPTTAGHPKLLPLQCALAECVYDHVGFATHPGDHPQTGLLEHGFGWPHDAAANHYFHPKAFQMLDSVNGYRIRPADFPTTDFVVAVQFQQ
jgi:hypothetical protein